MPECVDVDTAMICLMEVTLMGDKSYLYSLTWGVNFSSIHAKEKGGLGHFYNIFSKDFDILPNRSILWVFFSRVFCIKEIKTGTSTFSNICVTALHLSEWNILSGLYPLGHEEFETRRGY